MCSRYQHCFCRPCITQHLQNAQRCPTCNDELTVETLAEPQRMVKEVINELNIHCVYNNRGCQEIPQLQHLNRHEDSCGFAPVVCTNEGCGVTVNKRDLLHHESEQCEYRKLKCHSCGEMTITLANMEQKVTKIESKITNTELKIGSVEKNMASMQTKITKMEKKITNTESKIGSVEKSVADMGEKIGAVNNEVKGLKTALVESFDQMKDVLVKMENSIKENTRKIRNTPSGEEDKIFVAGGTGNGSVEIFNWSQKSWTPLQSLPQNRFGATAFVHDNHVVTTGGCSLSFNFFDNMIRMKIDPNPDL